MGALLGVLANPATRMAIYAAVQYGGKQILKHVAKSGFKRAAKSQVLKNPEKFGRRVYKKIEKKILEKPVEQGQKNTIGANKLERSPQSDIFIKEGTTTNGTTNNGWFNIKAETPLKGGPTNGTSSTINDAGKQLRDWQTCGNPPSGFKNNLWKK